MARLIDVKDCPCDGCKAKPCGHPARCVKFALWLNKTVDAVVMPCKIGDKVYRIDKGNFHSNWTPFIEELTVTEISWKKEKYGSKDLGFAIIANGIRYKFSSIGKSVFLTKEEAQAKMDGERKDNG